MTIVQLILPDGGFEIKGLDVASIVKLAAVPPWVSEAYSAWKENDGDGNCVIHFATGCTCIVAAPEVVEIEKGLAEESAEIFRKAEQYSDYHKDFYGYRPSDIAGLSPRELALRYDLISAEHQRLLQTAAGRAELRANGWSVPDEPVPPARKAPARKAAAKKVARRR